MPRESTTLEREPTRHSAFRRVLVAASGSTFGDGLVFVALPLLANRLTDDPRQIAGILAAERSAWLLALVTGAFADRFSRVLTMVTADIVRFMLLAVVTIAVMSHNLHSVWPLYGVGFLMGLATSAFYASSNSLVPKLVPDERLVHGLSRLQLVSVTSDQFAGRAAGSVLFGIARALPFGVDALTFLFSASWLSTLQDPLAAHARPPRPRHWLRNDIRGALRFVRNDVVLRGLAVFITAMASTQAMFVAVLVPYATRVLHLGDSWVGLFIASSAVGDLTGTYAPRIRNRMSLGRYLPIAVVVSAAGVMMSGAVASAPFVAAALIFEAFAVSSANIMTQAARQRAMPDAHRATLVNFIRMTVYAGVPIGAIAGGIIGRSIGLRWTFVIAGSLQLLILPFVVRAFTLPSLRGETAL